MASSANCEFAERLSGLSQEQLGIYRLKACLDCSAWWKKAVGLEKDEFLRLFSSVLENFQQATYLIGELYTLSEPRKSADFIQILHSSSVAINYLRLLAIILDQQSSLVSFSDKASIRIVLQCMDVCFTSLKSASHGDRLIDDLLECLDVLLTVSAKALATEGLSGTQQQWVIRCSNSFLGHATPFLGNYSNKKKLYVTFCQRMVGSCAQIVHECQARADTLEDAQALVHNIETLSSTALFSDDKYVEDLAMSAAPRFDSSTVGDCHNLPLIFMQMSGDDSDSLAASTTPVKGSKKSKGNDGDAKKDVASSSSATVKTSFYSNLYDAISNLFTATSLIPSHEHKQKATSSPGIGGGIAQILRVYASCSDRLLNASVKGAFGTGGAGAASSSSTTLTDRRKHAVRILQVAFSIILALESAYAKTLEKILAGISEQSQSISKGASSSNPKLKQAAQKTDKKKSTADADGVNEATTDLKSKLSYALVCFVNAKKALYESLSQCLDEAGGTAALATHDSMRPYAARLHLACGRSLRNLLDASLAAFVGSCNGATVRSLLTEALGAELDCVRIIAGIDHRAITMISSTFTPTAEQSLEGSGMVLRALVRASLPVNTAGDDGQVADDRLASAKLSLLLAVVRLYADLRAMHEFVKLVLSVADGEEDGFTNPVVPVQSGNAALSLSTLLQSSEVDSLVVKELAALPNSLLELVWEAVAGTEEGEQREEGASYTRQGFATRALIVRSLVMSAALSSAGSDAEGSQLSQLSAANGLSSISLATALPAKSVTALSALFQKAVAALQTNSRDDDSLMGLAAHSIICSLLQLASSAIVLAPIAVSKSKDGEVNVDLWLDFRKAAKLLAAQPCIQQPFGNGAGDEEGGGDDVLLACGSLLALSAFCSTCSAMTFSMDDAIQASEDTSANELCTALDNSVYSMLLKLCGHAEAPPADSEGRSKKRSMSKKGSDAASKKGSAVSPADAVLLIFRSMAVWSHLAVPVEAIAGLLRKHVEAIASSDRDDDVLASKHVALCELMRKPIVLDTPVLLNACLRAIVDTLGDVQPSKDVLVALLQFPVDALLAAAAEAKDLDALPQLTIAAAQALTSISSSNSADADALVDIVSMLLLACLQSRTRRGLLSRSYVADIRDADGGGRISAEEVDTWCNVDLELLSLFQSLATDADFLGKAESSSSLLKALQALVDVLLCSPFCGVNKKYTDVIASQETSKKRKSAANSNDSTVNNPHVVLLSVVSMINSRLSSSAEAAVVMNSRTPKKQKKTVAPTSSRTAGSDSRILVQLFHRVSAFYCSASAEIESAETDFDAISSAVRGLLDDVSSHLQKPGEHSGAGINWDQCCHVAADCLRILARFQSAQSAVAEEASEALKFDVIPLPEISLSEHVTSLDGWFLLAGTVFLLQAQQGLKLSIRASLALVKELQAAIQVAATSLVAVTSTNKTKSVDQSLLALTVCLEGIMMCMPAMTRNSIGEMFVKIMESVANTASTGRKDIHHDESRQQQQQQLGTVLARFAIAGADCVLNFGGASDGELELGGDGSSPLACARSVLELSALYAISTGTMGDESPLLSSIVVSLRKGVQCIQQKQQRRGRRRLGKGANSHNGADDDDDVAGFNKELSLSSWAGCCLSVLSKIAPRLSQHFDSRDAGKFDGGEKPTGATTRRAEEKTSVEISMHALATLEMLFSSDSAGGSSLTILGNSVGCIGSILATAIRVIVAADEAVDAGNGNSKTDAEFGQSVSDALRIASRALSAASSSKELMRHANFLAVAVVDLLAQRPLTANTRQLLLPGLFALFDKCRQRQRQQMFSTSALQTRAVLSELHGAYLRDYKFTGKA